jgi:hypothetical protein
MGVSLEKMMGPAGWKGAFFGSLMAALLIFFSGCATPEVRRAMPLTVSQIVEMSKGGVPADEIIERMRDSGAVYRLKASELARLHEEGVPDAVIDYMQETYLEALRRHEIREDWRSGFWYGGFPPEPPPPRFK